VPPSNLGDVIKLPVPCSSCGKEFMETVRRLQTKRSATCTYCGTVIDTSSEEWIAYVDEFAEACDSLQIPYSKLG
jgi:transcription elongation factor Elf1